MFMPPCTAQLKPANDTKVADSDLPILTILGWLPLAGPVGYAIGLHVTFTWPRYMLQSYAAAWQDIYTRHGMVVTDPTVRWGFANTGSCRWSDLKDLDDAGVLSGAADHGLRFGCTVALLDGGTRTIASFARADREFRDDEITEIAECIALLHGMTQDEGSLTPAMRARLAQLSTRRGA